MVREYRDINFLVGDLDVLRNMEHTRALPLFSKNVISFLCRLSEVLLHDLRAKSYGDVVAFAFWIRRAAIEREAVKYAAMGSRIGWGMAFHITPSNIPVQFAVSLVYALIAGNASVLRVSDKSFPQVDLLCETIRTLLQQEFQELRPYICIVDTHTTTRQPKSCRRYVISESYGAAIGRSKLSEKALCSPVA